MNKNELRNMMKRKRMDISLHRKYAVEEILSNFLIKYLDVKKNILSFCSFQEEISMSIVNKELCSKNKLFLPKIIDGELKIYQITQLWEQTEKSSFGINEPITNQCKKVSLNTIDCILVPGLAFDTNNARLGYGKGFYDKLLTNFKGTSIGIGYKEQKVNTVPIEPHDQRLTHVMLF